VDDHADGSWELIQRGGERTQYPPSCAITEKRPGTGSNSSLQPGVLTTASLARTVLKHSLVQKGVKLNLTLSVTASEVLLHYATASVPIASKGGKGAWSLVP